jgi:homoserine kinase
MVIGKEISVFAPASVANVTCGFDILGFPLDGTGDKLVMKAIPEQTIKIRAIEGFDLPLDPDKNVVGVVIKKFMQDLNIKTGFELSIRKGVKPGSGMGSSAASAAAAAFAVNELAGKPLSTKELVKYAMVGEKLASGNAHADNVAPALLGNFVLIRSYAPLDIIQLKAPEELYCTVVHPHIQVKTEDSRMILKKQIPLKKAIEQWGNVAGLVTGILTSDYPLIGRSMHDVIIEPVRSILIPMFDEVKSSVMKAGALGCGISGSGPSIFTFSQGEKNARNVQEQMKNIYKKLGVGFDIHVSKINKQGTQII